jgi:putative PIN family toxin of toxin-antitoxin system
MDENLLVLDANVFVSAIISSSSKARQAFDRCVDTGIILMSDPVFSEISEVLLRPKFDRYIDRAKRQNFIEDLLKIVNFVEIDQQISECRDPKDNKYLELAVCGGAKLIVTGDNDLLVLHPFRRITILNIQDFLEQR